jgi:hypothetical protein
LHPIPFTRLPSPCSYKRCGEILLCGVVSSISVISPDLSRAWEYLFCLAKSKPIRPKVVCLLFVLPYLSSIDVLSEASPTKRGSLLTTVSSPLMARSKYDTIRGSGSSLHYPASRSFSDKSTFFVAFVYLTSFSYLHCLVPIYDGRGESGRGFNFTDEDFQSLTSLPLYRNGKKDLPNEAVVAVGYTLSTYEGTQSRSKILSSNVQFVILLGVPAASL